MAYNKKKWLAAYIIKENTRKAKERRKFSLKLMENYEGLYPCSTCFHGQVGACNDNLPNGCEYHYDQKADICFPIEKNQATRKRRQVRSRSRRRKAS